MSASADYKSLAATAQERRRAAIPLEYIAGPECLQNLPRDLITHSQSCGHFSHDELAIIESDVDVILRNIKNRSAALAQQLTNCLTEILFPEALARAQELDEYQARHGTTIGPLHGLPVSLKDNFIVPPHPSSIGMADLANISTEKDQPSVLVSILRDLGAITYVKTNVPTAMMMMETNNNVWGPVINPHHTGCNPGGSSGGEGALIAMRGSPIGIGTDIGGSIRIPSAFCGLYGLKPSSGRFPQWGGRSGIPGQEVVLAVNGPMARSLSALKTYSAAVLSDSSVASPWTKDPKALPIAWRPGPHIVPVGRKLRIAFAPSCDGLCTVHPPLERGLAQTRAALEASGHETIDWNVDGHDDILKLLVDIFHNFGGKPIVDMMAKHGEPIFPSMEGYAQASEAGETIIGPTQLRGMNVARNSLQKAYLDRWADTAEPVKGKGPIDALVMAASPWTAVRAGFTNQGQGQQYLGYTGVFSLLDLPVCTLPVTKADAKLDRPRSEYSPLNQLDGIIQADYDPDFYHGTPVTLQCIGERLSEEKLLEIVGIIENSIMVAQNL